MRAESPRLIRPAKKYASNRPLRPKVPGLHREAKNPCGVDFAQFLCLKQHSFGLASVAPYSGMPWGWLLLTAPVPCTHWGEERKGEERG
jgi:hypothetical protein